MLPLLLQLPFSLFLPIQLASVLLMLTMLPGPCQALSPLLGGSLSKLTAAALAGAKGATLGVPLRPCVQHAAVATASSCGKGETFSEQLQRTDSCLTAPLPVPPAGCLPAGWGARCGAALLGAGFVLPTCAIYFAESRARRHFGRVLQSLQHV